MVCAHPIIGTQLALCMAVLLQETPLSGDEHEDAWALNQTTKEFLQLTPEQITCLAQFKDFPEEYRSAYLDGTCFVAGPSKPQRRRRVQVPIVDFAPLDFSASILQPH